MAMSMAAETMGMYLSGMKEQPSIPVESSATPSQPIPRHKNAGPAFCPPARYSAGWIFYALCRTGRTSELPHTCHGARNPMDPAGSEQTDS